MGRGSGSIRPHLAVLLLLTGVLAGLLLRTPVPSVPTPLPQGEVGERIAAALPACRMTQMPKRFWGTMTEFQNEPEERKELAP
mgnify:CR=1 FL=1